MARRTRFKNLTASGQIAAGGITIEGFFVNSTSSGTMILYHGIAAANTGNPYSAAEITPASVGFYELAGADFTAGAYVALGPTSSSMDVTFLIRERD